jgi:hypothetical protein
MSIREKTRHSLRTPSSASADGFDVARSSGEPPRTRTRRLLLCGIVAGPLFITVSLIQAGTREGFDLSRHPLSLLSVGELGWIQITNFVATGALYIACAVGMRQALHGGRSGTWGPRLVGILGAGLILAGVFVSDAGAGYPPGALEGAPDEVSWHGLIHGIGAVLSFNGMTLGCLVFVRRFKALKSRGWVAACIATTVAVSVITSPYDPDSISVRLVIGSAILFGFVAVLAARLMRGLPRAAPPPAVV